MWISPIYFFSYITESGVLPTQGYIYLVGNNTRGQLGDNTTTPEALYVDEISTSNNWVNISGRGSRHVAGIKSDGKLWTWGDNFYGQLGDNTGGSNTQKSSPVQTVAGGTNWSYINTSYAVTYGIKTDGRLWLWGKNYYGELGDNTIINKSSPIQTVSGGTNWESATGGYKHTVAIKTDGTLWTWGYNYHGQLGNSTVDPKSSPIQTVAGGTTWKQASGGYGHTAAVKDDGTLWIWGYNYSGQLGDNTITDRSSPIQTVAGGSDWKNVYAGSNSTLAIKNNGSMWAWGENSSGELGVGDITLRSSPIQVVGNATTWSKVITYGGSTAAVKIDGTLWGWGTNGQGQLGLDTYSGSYSSPVQTLMGGTTWIDVICGGSFAGGISGNSLSVPNGAVGSLWSWGLNDYGQIGDNTQVSRSVPAQQNGHYTDWGSMLGYTKYNTRAVVKPNGTLWMWGRGDQGQMGNGFTTTVNLLPFQSVDSNTNWAKIATGVFHAAGIKTDGTLWLWGYNNTGELGDNTVVSKSSPVQIVTGGTNWESVAVAYEFTAAIKTDGTLWTWGRNDNGALGDNTRTNRSSPVQTIAGGTNWNKLAIAGGVNNTMGAIKDDGTLWSWGLNSYGQLGDNTRTDKSSPVQTVAGGTNWAQFDMGDLFTAAVKTDGTLWLWGRNTSGDLGDNTTAHKSSPVQTIAGGTIWVKATCGGQHVGALKTDNTLWVWGSNASGELGDNTTVNKSSPIQVIFRGSTWADVNCMLEHTTAIK